MYLSSDDESDKNGSYNAISEVQTDSYKLDTRPVLSPKKKGNIFPQDKFNKKKVKSSDYPTKGSSLDKDKSLVENNSDSSSSSDGEPDSSYENSSDESSSSSEESSEDDSTNRLRAKVIRYNQFKSEGLVPPKSKHNSSRDLIRGMSLRQRESFYSRYIRAKDSRMTSPLKKARSQKDTDEETICPANVLVQTFTQINKEYILPSESSLTASPTPNEVLDSEMQIDSNSVDDCPSLATSSLSGSVISESGNVTSVKSKILVDCPTAGIAINNGSIIEKSMASESGSQNQEKMAQNENGERTRILPEEIEDTENRSKLKLPDVTLEETFQKTIFSQLSGMFIIHVK